MDEDEPGADERKISPRIVNANRVTVALPFSKIAVEESSDDVRDLSALVADLADALAAVAGNDETAELAERARALRERVAR
ncbi:MAG TPA: hypothetical protein VEP49_13375 [Acidimicrobiia bacterium]|nr:hypothetical protein [Acidimicrobiia bacterium]